MGQTRPFPVVMTLEEAARYLRVSKDTLKKHASEGTIPGRLIGRAWRFSKLALDEWLAKHDSTRALLEQAGAFADDETLPALRKAIYAARGRPETDDGPDAIRKLKIIN